MEMIFIVLMAWVLVHENWSKIKDWPMVIDAIDTIRNNRSGVIKYFGAAAILAMVFQALPMLLVTIYMRKEGFFAYELFGEDAGALDILSLNVLFNYLFLSVYLFLAAFTIIHKTNWWTKVGGVLLSAFIFGMFVYFTVLTGNYLTFLSIMSFCILLGGYLVFWLMAGFNAKAKYWWVPCIFAGVFLVLPVVAPDAAARLVESSFAQMKVGGLNAAISENIDFKEPPTRNYIEGKLLLRTTMFYYFRPKDKKDTVLTIRTDHATLRYKT